MTLSPRTLELCARLVADARVTGDPGDKDFDDAVEQILTARRELAEARAKT